MADLAHEEVDYECEVLAHGTGQGLWRDRLVVSMRGEIADQVANAALLEAFVVHWPGIRLQACVVGLTQCT